ncbi:MAG: tRNA (cytidine(34)-2'-O)-methyltransferase [Rickettsiales bacterium]|nr:tRNA (cytidine(34)-2'-O)-methyltransferase [Rickettsiales bacterium]
MQLVMYQPDIPHNLGSFIRLGVCFSVSIHVVEPCGFPFDDKRIKSRALDYGEHVDLIRHASWDAFQAYRLTRGGRLILASTRGATSLYEHVFQPDDWLIFGSESSGVHELVHQCSDARVIIPIAFNGRSLNVAIAAAIVLSEGLRQCSLTPAISRMID